MFSKIFETCISYLVIYFSLSVYSKAGIAGSIVTSLFVDSVLWNLIEC